MGYPAKKDLLIYRGDDSKWPMQIRRAQEYADTTITESSATITSATAAFTQDDVNRTVLLQETNLTTTIVSVTSATEAELAVVSQQTYTAATLYIWRPLDLTSYLLTAVARKEKDPLSPVIATFSCTVTNALDGRFDLALSKEESVNVNENLFWDLQTVDSSNGDWTETILAGSVKPKGQVTT